MIAYHGTNYKEAEIIAKEGFRVGTYFAFRRRDARKFGPIVFKVYFSDDPQMWRGEADGWQFWTREHIPAAAIVAEYERGHLLCESREQ